jgi:hypothetical protein
MYTFAVANPQTGQVLAGYAVSQECDVATNTPAGMVAVPIPPDHPLLFGTARPTFTYNGTAIVEAVAS